MRRTALLVVAVLALPAVADEPPIPYDAAQAKKLRERYRAWVKATTLDAYLKVGKRDRKWDDLVIKALTVNVERTAGSPWGQADAQAVFGKLIPQAVAAGCDDPLVRYHAGRHPVRPTDATTKKDSLDAARALAASKYPDIRKAHAWLNAIAELQFVPKPKPGEEANKADPDDLRAAGQCLDELLKVLARMVKETDPSQREDVIDLCDLVHRNGNDIGERTKWFDRLEAEVFKGLPKDNPLPDLIAGMYLTALAWDARGDGPGRSLTGDAAAQFRESLEQAEKRLEKAWELDPTLSRAAATMINVCTGLGRDRAVMEVWFKRALEANPDEPRAFIPKMRFIHPNWHGTKEDVLAYGRQAAKSENWEGKVPTLLPKAHYEIAAFTADFQGYFRNQPEVWKEIEPVLEGIRKRYPTSRLGASWYMYYAWVSDKNPVQAYDYSKAVGHDLILNPFTRQVEVDQAIRWAKRGSLEAKEKK